MKPIIWTLAEAQEVAAAAEAVVRPLGYHTCLGGGVLHRGESGKDMDLFFLPLEGHHSDPDSVLRELYRLWGSSTSLLDAPDYVIEPGSPARRAKQSQRFVVRGRRVDVFIY